MYAVFVSLLLALLFQFSNDAQARDIKLDHKQSVFAFLERNNVSAALLHAKQVGNPLLLKYVYWMYLRSPSSEPSFSELRDFIEKNPDWPDRDKLISRAEATLIAENPSESELREWFSKYPPMTRSGKISAAKDKKGDISEVVRAAWIEGDYSQAQETRLLSKYANLLRTEDHIARASRLVWDEEYSAAKRMFPRIPAAYRQVVLARIALKENDRHATRELAKVQGNLMDDVGLLYDRMRWRSKKGQDEGVQEILLKAPSQVPYAKQWWPLRQKFIRIAIEDKNYKLARKLLTNHGQIDGPERVDALFLSGWLRLEFEGQAKQALQEFSALYGEANYPHSKARAAYWAGRAAAKSGDKEHAKSWYAKASEFPTTYYGQLAYHENNSQSPLSLPATPMPTAAETAAYNKQELPQLVRLLVSLGEDDRTMRFINHMANTAKSKSEAALVAQLGLDIGRADFSVKAAKRALQNGFLLVDYAYPRMSVKFSISLEKPVILALTRQESEFNPRAISPSNAIGMMQLLPSTAKEVAKKSGIPYSRNRLFEPQFNMELGSIYFTRLLEKFDGSYILAAAGYNAGPGRVNQWVKRFGYPGSDYHKAINWVEMIPFEETRNYVQRVLENTQVYRHLAAGEKKPALMIAKDLVR